MNGTKNASTRPWQLKKGLKLKKIESQLPSKVLAAYLTCPNQEIAKKIANGIVSLKIAACVNIIPQLQSVYLWEGELKNDDEVLLWIKLSSDQSENLKKYTTDHHPYENPGLIFIQVEDGLVRYLEWVRKNCDQA